MKSKTLENGYLIRLEKGERIIETLTVFCQRMSIDSGVISGIGGASDITLGYYDLTTKKYAWRNFEKIYEIVSMTGNLSIVNDIPFFHIHMVISDDNFQSFGGHLKEATVGATCELVIQQVNMPLTRSFDNEIGLKLLDFES